MYGIIKKGFIADNESWTKYWILDGYVDRNDVDDEQICFLVKSEPYYNGVGREYANCPFIKAAGRLRNKTLIVQRGGLDV